MRIIREKTGFSLPEKKFVRKERIFFFIRFGFTSQNRVDNGTEIRIQFFRSLFHPLADPPLYHTDKAAGNVVEKKFIGKIFIFTIGSGKKESFYNLVEAVFEIFQKNAAAFGSKQFPDMVGVGLYMLENMAKNRIGNARIHVTVTRKIMV